MNVTEYMMKFSVTDIVYILSREITHIYTNGVKYRKNNVLVSYGLKLYHNFCVK